jgi:hypothetical protein
VKNMGERYISYKKCPECGKKYEVYDAPSSSMYSAHCKCGYDENLSYVDIDGDYYLVNINVYSEIERLRSALSHSQKEYLDVIWEKNILESKVSNLESEILDLEDEVSCLEHVKDFLESELSDKS